MCLRMNFPRAFVCINGGGGGVRASAQTASDGIGMVSDERAVVWERKDALRPAPADAFLEGELFSVEPVTA